jgi:hypothetical protein
MAADLFKITFHLIVIAWSWRIPAQAQPVFRPVLASACRYKLGATKQSVEKAPEAASKAITPARTIASVGSHTKNPASPETEFSVVPACRLALAWLWTSVTYMIVK